MAMQQATGLGDNLVSSEYEPETDNKTGQVSDDFTAAGYEEPFVRIDSGGTPDFYSE